MTPFKRWYGRQSAALLLIAVCLGMMVFLSLQTQSFFSWKNVVNILEANSYRLLLAIGMMCIIASGAIDLSVGSILSLSAILMATALKVAECNSCMGRIVAAPTAGRMLCAKRGIDPFYKDQCIHYYPSHFLPISGSFPYDHPGHSHYQAAPGFPGYRLRRYSGHGVRGHHGRSGHPAAHSPFLLYEMGNLSHVPGRQSGSPETKRRKYRPIPYYLLCSHGRFIRYFRHHRNSPPQFRRSQRRPKYGNGCDMRRDYGRNSAPWRLGTVVAVFLLGLIRNGLTIMSVSSYYQQFVTGAILLCAVIVAELRERRTRIS